MKLKPTNYTRMEVVSGDGILKWKCSNCLEVCRDIDIKDQQCNSCPTCGAVITTWISLDEEEE